MGIGTGHRCFSWRRSNTIFTPWRRPALAACSIASTVPRWIADQPGRATTDPAIGWALATFALAAAAGGVIAGRVASRFGFGRLLRMSLLAAAIPASALAFTAPATAASFAALLLTGLLIGPGIPLLLVAAQNEAPDRAADTAALTPAGPPPTTTMSERLTIGMSRFVAESCKSDCSMGIPLCCKRDISA